MSQLLLHEGAAAATPSLGKLSIYVKSDKEVYGKDDAGVEHLLSAEGDLKADGSTPLTAGSAAGAVAQRFGSDATEGYEIKVVDETLSGLAAISTDLTADIPDGAYILSVQANIETLVVAGGTSVKVGIGPTGDPDKYGITSAFTKNLKIDIIPVHAVLSGAEDVQVNMCATGGGIGDTAASAGAVRARIVYALPNSLADAV